MCEVFLKERCGVLTGAGGVDKVNKDGKNDYNE